MPRLRLHHRLVIPFALIALVTTTATALVTLWAATRPLDGRIRAQLTNAALIVGRSELALNASVLRNVRDITGADVITYRSDGQVLASTLDPARHAAIISAIETARATAPEGRSDSEAVFRIECGGSCYVASRSVAGRPDTIVAVLEQTSHLAVATARVTRAVLLASLTSLLVMTLVGQALARRLTAPLDRLLAFAREADASDVHRRAAIGNDEVGRLAAAFNGMLDRLERSQASVIRSEKLGLAGLMAAQVAHDIRNPLSSIKIQTQLLKARLEPRHAHLPALTSMLRDVAQIEHVIDDLLELARPGRLNLQPSDLDSVVQEVVEQMNTQLAHRKIVVRLELDAAPHRVPLDASRFKRAIINLVANAAEAMPEGGTLRLASRRSADGSMVELEIADNGVGVDPSMIDRVFDPFVSSKRDGIGLGLVNVRAVIDSHGGEITLLPNTPRGTRAIVRLPTASATRH